MTLSCARAIGRMASDPSLEAALNTHRKDSDMRELFRLAAKYGRKLQPVEEGK